MADLYIPVHEGAAEGVHEKAMPSRWTGKVTAALAILLGTAIVAVQLQRLGGRGTGASRAVDMQALSQLSLDVTMDKQRFHRYEQVKVLQVAGPAATAEVRDYLGEGMYRVRYIVDSERETVSESRLSLRNDRQASSPHGGGEHHHHDHHDKHHEDSHAGRGHDTHNVHGGRFNLSKFDISSPSAWVLLVLGVIATSALSVGACYFAYWYCRFPKRLPIREGAYVVVTGNFDSDNKAPVTLRKGDRGQVIRLDRNFALIDFYDYENQWVSHRNHQYLQVSAYGPVPAPARLACA